MKYVILLFVVSLMGCTKHYTNEECTKEVMEKICKNEPACKDESNRDDVAYATIAASLECAKNNNDPDKTFKDDK